MTEIQDETGNLSDFDSMGYCPHCKTMNAYVRRIGWYFVKCYSCGVIGPPHPDRHGAIDLWEFGEKHPKIKQT